MVDVSAQSCNVTPLNPTSLTATGGVIAYGTTNVRIRCSCTESNGTPVNTVRWYDPAGIRLVSAQNTEFNSHVPHFTRVNANSNRDVILVIPTFNDSYDGTYTCGRNTDHRSTLNQPNANVTLTISELMINTIIVIYCTHVLV